jgi:hypothetical protein
MALERGLSRRTLLRSVAAAGVGLLGIYAFGCGDDDDDDADDGESAPASPTDEATEEATEEPTEEVSAGPTLALVTGWYRGQEVRYYDFGMNTALAGGNTVQTAPLYVFIRGMNADGTPDFLPGQHNISDVVPGEEGYSDLWEIMLVQPPEDYEPDSIRSKADLDAAGFDVQPAGLFVNCPFVEAGTMLENGEELVQGWHDGEEVFYPDFGPNDPIALPIWAFVTGFDGDTPLFVDGQGNIIDSVPDDEGYSAFWRANMVMVPEDYEANSIQSAEDALAAGFEIVETDILVNCPVIEF